MSNGHIGPTASRTQGACGARCMTHFPSFPPNKGLGALYRTNGLLSLMTPTAEIATRSLDICVGDAVLHFWPHLIIN